jgi:hypothetical protein
MVNQQGRTVSLDFIAGLVVGEGSFCLAVNNLKHGKVNIKPGFVMQMNDGETMEIVYHSLREHGVGAYFHHRPNRGCWTVQVHGIKRVESLTKALMPWLTGTKKRSAELVLEFCQSRHETPRNYPYTDEQIDIVRRLREVNGIPNRKKNPLTGFNKERPGRKPTVTLRD